MTFPWSVRKQALNGSSAFHNCPGSLAALPFCLPSSCSFPRFLVLPSLELSFQEYLQPSICSLIFLCLNCLKFTLLLGVSSGFSFGQEESCSLTWANFFTRYSFTSLQVYIYVLIIYTEIENLFNRKEFRKRINLKVAEDEQ